MNLISGYTMTTYEPIFVNKASNSIKSSLCKSSLQLNRVTTHICKSNRCLNSSRLKDSSYTNTYIPKRNERVKYISHLLNGSTSSRNYISHLLNGFFILCPGFYCPRLFCRYACPYNIGKTFYVQIAKPRSPYTLLAKAQPFTILNPRSFPFRSFPLRFFSLFLVIVKTYQKELVRCSIQVLKDFKK